LSLINVIICLADFNVTSKHTNEEHELFKQQRQQKIPFSKILCKSDNPTQACCSKGLKTKLSGEDMRTLNLACTGDVLEALRKAVDEYSSIAEERSKETIRFLVAEITKFREIQWYVL